MIVQLHDENPTIFEKPKWGTLYSADPDQIMLNAGSDHIPEGIQLANAKM